MVRRVLRSFISFPTAALVQEESKQRILAVTGPGAGQTATFIAIGPMKRLCSCRPCLQRLSTSVIYSSGQEFQD